MCIRDSYEGQRALYDKLRSEALETGLTKALLRMAAPLTVTCYDRQLIQRVDVYKRQVDHGSAQGKIYRTESFIDIDCGCVYSGGRLGCLCLDTMEEIYV